MAVYGKRNDAAWRRWAVFSFQCPVIRRGMLLTEDIGRSWPVVELQLSLKSAPDKEVIPKSDDENCAIGIVNFKAPTREQDRSEQGVFIVWPTRRADAQPLAERVFLRIILCSDTDKILHPDL